MHQRVNCTHSVVLIVRFDSHEEVRVEPVCHERLRQTPEVILEAAGDSLVVPCIWVQIHI